jgi:2,4-dienoyl-CoA reductase-like NADH-dependent reductase (Old Yellow Enzyme family)
VAISGGIGNLGTGHGEYPCRRFAPGVRWQRRRLERHNDESRRPAMSSLRQLFTPISIGTMEVKNRIAMAPMASDYAASDGSVSQRLIDYLVARAEGGVGLITCEMTTIDEFSPYVLRTVALWDDKFIPGFKRLSDAVHAHGAKIIPQIAHPGPESLSPFLHQRQPVGPSPVMCFVTKHVSRELEHDEIGTIIEQFGEAARRAREAGCDGMELHAAHSYMLVGSFLSPLRNKRADEYGGDLDGRLRLPLRVIERIREKAGAGRRSISLRSWRKRESPRFTSPQACTPTTRAASCHPRERRCAPTPGLRGRSKTWSTYR